VCALTGSGVAAVWLAFRLYVESLACRLLRRGHIEVTAPDFRAKYRRLAASISVRDTGIKPEQLQNRATRPIREKRPLPDNYGLMSHTSHPTYGRRLAHILATRDVCHWCGRWLDPDLKWPHPHSATVDHIIPVSRPAALTPVASLSRCARNATKDVATGGDRRSPNSNRGNRSRSTHVDGEMDCPRPLGEDPRRLAGKQPCPQPYTSNCACTMLPNSILAKLLDPTVANRSGGGGDVRGSVIQDRIRDVLAAHGRMPVDPREVDDQADLYELGLTSHASVDVMLALEEAFDIEFPDEVLKKSTFASVRNIEQVVEGLVKSSA
jgi:acyl carrier protein